MNPIFVLSYPRSRTCWLATYLAGGGEMAYHELWRRYATMGELRRFMDSKGAGPVVNVDCANWFFLDEIRSIYPHAQFIRINRKPDGVIESLREVFGDQDYDPMMQAYEDVIQRSVVSPVLTIDFEHWTPEESLRIWRAVSNFPIDPEWHEHMHDMDVQITMDAIRKGMEQDLGHLKKKLGRA
ncbi:MAG: hypothetical protein CV089_18250 [Nitrospira sp. WS110]|nr:hypothetical protein [Nitrospira sp. WS110]